MSEKCRPTSQEYRELWSQKLRPRVPLPFKAPRVNVKPKCRVKRVNWCLPGLYSMLILFVISHLRAPLALSLKKSLALKLCTLLAPLCMCMRCSFRWKDELNLILLATQFCLVEEVRIHNFHLNYFSPEEECMFASSQPTGGLSSSYCPTSEEGLGLRERGRERGQ